MGMSLRYAPQGRVNCPLQGTSELAHKRDKDAVPPKGCGQLPARSSPFAGWSRKGVPLPSPSPILTNFVYKAVKHRILCRPKKEIKYEKLLFENKNVCSV
jgi:hypothetical protein